MLPTDRLFAYMAVYGWNTLGTQVSVSFLSLERVVNPHRKRRWTLKEKKKKGWLCWYKRGIETGTRVHLVLVAEVLRRHVLRELERLRHCVLVRRGSEGRVDVAARVGKGVLGRARHAAVAEPEGRSEGVRAREAGCGGLAGDVVGHVRCAGEVRLRSAVAAQAGRRHWLFGAGVRPRLLEGVGEARVAEREPRGDGWGVDGTLESGS